MKFQSTTLLPVINRTSLKNLTNIANETLDVLSKEIKSKKFTSAELWMIQKQRRSFSSRRFI